MASTFRFVWDGNVLLHETFKKDNSENTELTTWVFEGFVPTAKLVMVKRIALSQTISVRLYSLLIARVMRFGIDS